MHDRIQRLTVVKRLLALSQIGCRLNGTSTSQRMRGALASGVHYCNLFNWRRASMLQAACRPVKALH